MGERGGEARSDGTVRLVAGCIGSGVSHLLGRTTDAVRCVGLETARHPFEPFLPITDGILDDDAGSMAGRLRTVLGGSGLVIDDAHLLPPEALDVVDDLARDHDVTLGAHPGEGNWGLLHARWRDRSIEWVEPATTELVAAVIGQTGTGDPHETAALADRVGPLPGVGRALAAGDPLATATLDRLAAIVDGLDDLALDWILDVALLPAGVAHPDLADPPETFGLSHPLLGVPRIVADVATAAAGQTRVALRRQTLADRIDDPIVRARLLLDAGAVDDARAVAAHALSSIDDPDRRATLAAIASSDDASALLAASLLVARERPDEAAEVLRRVDDRDGGDAIVVRAAVGRQLDHDERWALLDRLPVDGPEHRRQRSWFDALTEDPSPAHESTAPPDPTTTDDLDVARWAWTTHAVSVPCELAAVAETLDRPGLNDSWQQFVRHLGALDRWHRVGVDRETVELLRVECVPALPRVVLDAHRAVALADLGDTSTAIDIAAGLPTTAPSERMLAAWATAEVELAAGRPLAAVRATAAVDGIDHPFVTPTLLVRAWATWEASEPHQPAHGSGGSPGHRAVDFEFDALALVRGDDPRTAAQVFDDAADHWSGVHARGELRCRFGAAESRRLAGEQTRAIDQLTAVERVCVEAGYGPLLQRVRRSLRLAGVQRRGRRSTSDGPLSPREAEVIELVGKGLTSRDIATRLGIARTTVETQITAAMNKLGARTRLQAALTYRELQR